MRVVRTLLAAEVHRRIAARRSSEGGSVRSLGRKLLWLAHASSNVPSTVKCSSESKPAARASARTSRKNACAMSPSKRRSRFLLKTSASKRRHPYSGRRTSGTTGCTAVAPSADVRCARCTAPAATTPATIARADRRPTNVGIQPVKARRQPREHGVGHLANRAQRMVAGTRSSGDK